MSGFNALRKSLMSLDKDVEQVIKDTLSEFMNKILNEALSNLPSGAGSVRSGYHITISDSGNLVTIWTENEVAAWIEFGTGDYAHDYLMTQEDEVLEEAVKFYVNGDGTMPARPYLFPAYDKYKFEIAIEINKRIQKVLDAVK